MYIQKFNQRLDWSVVDLALISRHFTGHKTLACSICGSFSHTSFLCRELHCKNCPSRNCSLKSPCPALLTILLNVRYLFPQDINHLSALISMRAFVHFLIVNLCMCVVGVRTAILALCPAPSCKIGEINMKHPSTPVNVSALSKALSKHPSRCSVNYLITGLVQGFLAGLCWLPKVTHVCKNLQSALKEPEIVDELLSKGATKGYMVGPFSESPFSIYRVSPRMLQPGNIHSKNISLSIYWLPMTPLSQA